MAQTITVCRQCHSAIHRFVPNHKDLGRHYNSKEKLLEHEGIFEFVAWARKQK